MNVQCQCGAIQFKTPLPHPLALYICHCNECRRQTSSAFGTSAIFPRFPLPRSDLLSVYKRPVSSGHTLYCYFCQACGTRLIHSTPGKSVISVKGGCIEGLEWSKAIHIWTKSAMVPIPEGSESFSEEPSESDYCASTESLDYGQERGEGTPASSILSGSGIVIAKKKKGEEEDGGGSGSGSDGYEEVSGSGREDDPSLLHIQQRPVKGACELSG